MIMSWDCMQANEAQVIASFNLLWFVKLDNEHKPWLTNKIKQLIFHRDYLRRQSVRVSSTDNTQPIKGAKIE